MPQRDPKYQQALDDVLVKATTDLEFRQQLLADPAAAIQRYFGVAVPPTFRMRFVERGADLDALVVLPDYMAPDGELSELELESISGGADNDGWAGPPPDPPAAW